MEMAMASPSWLPLVTTRSELSSKFLVLRSWRVHCRLLTRWTRSATPFVGWYYLKIEELGIRAAFLSRVLAFWWVQLWNLGRVLNGFLGF